ncbi:GNAT family N-acetyltransferase [Lacticaseibacillus baoqingensis]|uniref:GNAT family N-acetyltransferase n=1 Tax=Lacticaseibacillus baoqingensis TaxID=2486013 RepID=A0ABW4E3Q2_9LACO|nr:GNAT family N-acetyltransferase [Lacticaseibacillus baoqingensis]
MTTTFAEATSQDLPAIVAIYNQAIPGRLATADLQPVSVASKQAWFAAYDPHTRPLWKIMVAGQLAGWVGLEDFYGRPAYQHTAEISIYIDTHFHHQGLGQQALDFVATQLPRLDINTLVAFIFAHNTPSLGLFNKNGFSRWAHLPDVALMDDQLRSLDILGRRY